MPARMRIDLDGVDLRDETGRLVAIFRFRTTQGLMLRLPESTDVVIPWAQIEEALIDLSKARVHVVFTADAVAAHSWLKRQRRIAGSWTDRRVLEGPPAE